MSWQTVRIGDQHYKLMMKFDERNGKFLVYMYAFEALWNAEVSFDETKAEMEKLNELTEFNDKDELVADMVNLFDAKRTDVDWVLEREDAELNLRLTSSDGCTEYLFKATFYKADSSVYHHILLVPLSEGIRLQNKRIQERGELLKKKDAVIREFKMSGATITRKSIETSEFNEDSSTFPAQLLDTISSNTNTVLDDYIVSLLNQVQPVIWKKSSENQEATEKSQVDQPIPEVANSSNVPVPKEITTELKEKSQEKIRQTMTFHRVNPMNTHKNRPVKKLKGL